MDIVGGNPVVIGLFAAAGRRWVICWRSYNHKTSAHKPLIVEFNVGVKQVCAPRPNVRQQQINGYLCSIKMCDDEPREEPGNPEALAFQQQLFSPPPSSTSCSPIAKQMHSLVNPVKLYSLRSSSMSLPVSLSILLGN